MTIFQALANAGVPDGRMLNIDKIQILRTDPITGKTIQKEFDIRTVSIIESEFYYIKPNDLIYLATSSKSFFQNRFFSICFVNNNCSNIVYINVISI